MAGPVVRVVAALFERHGRVLLGQRGPGKARALEWELPGGKVEPGETDAEALARECREELSVEIEVGEHVGSVRHAYPDLTIELGLYRARLAEGNEPTQRGADRLAWIERSGLAEVELCAADRALVPAFTCDRWRTA